MARPDPTIDLADAEKRELIGLIQASTTSAARRQSSLISPSALSMRFIAQA